VELTGKKENVIYQPKNVQNFDTGEQAIRLWRKYVIALAYRYDGISKIS